MAIAIIGIGLILSLGVALLFPQTRDLILHFLDTIKDFYFNFIQTAPKWVKVMMFLFFISSFSGLITVFLNIQYFCDGSTVYEAENFVVGSALWMGNLIAGNETYGNLTQSQYDSILNNNSQEYQTPSILTPEGAFIVQCRSGSPRLTFFGIPIFDYRTWVLLIMIGLVIKIKKW